MSKITLNYVIPTTWKCNEGNIFKGMAMWWSCGQTCKKKILWKWPQLCEDEKQFILNYSQIKALKVKCGHF